MTFNAMVKRTEFRVEYGDLVRAVVPRRGQPYEHRCSERRFREVLEAIAALPGRFAVCELVESLDFAYSATYVAVAFLYERSLVEDAHGRRLVRAAGFDSLHAMADFHALAAGVEA